MKFGHPESPAERLAETNRRHPEGSDAWGRAYVARERFFDAVRGITATRRVKVPEIGPQEAHAAAMWAMARLHGVVAKDAEGDWCVFPRGIRGTGRNRITDAWAGWRYATRHPEDVEYRHAGLAVELGSESKTLY